MQDTLHVDNICWPVSWWIGYFGGFNYIGGFGAIGGFSDIGGFGDIDVCGYVDIGGLGNNGGFGYIGGFSVIGGFSDISGFGNICGLCDIDKGGICHRHYFNRILDSRICQYFKYWYKWKVSICIVTSYIVIEIKWDKHLFVFLQSDKWWVHKCR